MKPEDAKLENARRRAFSLTKWELGILTFFAVAAPLRYFEDSSPIVHTINGHYTLMVGRGELNSRVVDPPLVAAAPPASLQSQWYANDSVAGAAHLSSCMQRSTGCTRRLATSLYKLWSTSSPVRLA